LNAKDKESVIRALEMMNAENVRAGKPLYSFRPIPCELDEIVHGLVELFMNATPSERSEIIGLIPSDDGGFLIAFASRMATMGVREQSRERILDGLVALIMEDYKVDFRDTLMRVAPLYDATLKIGLDPEAVFREAAAFFGNETATNIVDFPSRPPELRTLNGMGFKESSDADGFRYVRSY